MDPPKHVGGSPGYRKSVEWLFDIATRNGIAAQAEIPYFIDP